MYELLYIIPAIYAEDELKNVTAKIDALLKDEGAEVMKSEVAGKLKFAYPIKRHTVGFYVLVSLNAAGEILKKINRALQLEKDILRFMITECEESKPESKEVKIKEFVEVDPSEKRPAAKSQYRGQKDKDKEKDKIKLEDIEKKLDTLLEKDIV